MDPNSTVREDLELFRRVLRVMNVLQRQEAIHQPIQERRMSCPTARDSNLQRWRSNIETQDAIEGLGGSLNCELYGDTDDENEDYDEDGEEDNHELDDIDDDDDDDTDSDEEEEEDDNVHVLGYEDDEEDQEDEDEDDSEMSWSYEQNGQVQHPEDPSTLAPSASLYCVPPGGPPPAPSTTFGPASTRDSAPIMGQVHSNSNDLCCWEHGCNGRRFTTRSNLRRHLREKSKARPSCQCPRCGAIFSRTTARNTHVANGSCNRIRRYSNGRARPRPRFGNT